MSEEFDQGATTVRASKGGGLKWLLGAAGAVVLLGGGYFVWKNLAPSQDRTETAYNDPYVEEPLRAGPLEPSQDTTAEDNGADEASASPETPATAPARRATRRAVPEETIGVTPTSATDESAPAASEDLVVTAPRRPIWTRRPSPRRLAALYPERALDRGREGEARLHCIVQDGGALDCERVSATPGGFGNAALRVARALRHSPTLADGSDAVGTPVNLRVVFRIEDEPRRG